MIASCSAEIIELSLPKPSPSAASAAALSAAAIRSASAASAASLLAAAFASLSASAAALSAAALSAAALSAAAASAAAGAGAALIKNRLSGLRQLQFPRQVFVVGHFVQLTHNYSRLPFSRSFSTK